MSRHGKIAEGKTTINFILPKELKERLLQMAEKDGRTLSNFLVHQLWKVAGKTDNAKR